jgi:lipase
MTSARPVERVLVPRGGGHLAVFRYGGSGPAVMLIHGITSSHLAWQFLARRLIDAGFEVWAVDLRGRGDSRDVGGPYGMAVHADDVVAIFDHLGIESADVIGHSMGAFVTAVLHSRHTTRVRTLTFIDGGVPLPLPEGMTVEQVMPVVLGPALARLSMTFESNVAYRDYWRAHPALASAWGPELEAYVDHDLRDHGGVLVPSAVSEAVVRDSEDLWGGDAVDLALKGLDREVLLLRAERGLQNEPTPLYPDAALANIERTYPRVCLVTIPDTNHYDILMSDAGAQRVAQLMSERTSS